jgi:hypothetical protein
VVWCVVCGVWCVVHVVREVTVYYRSKIEVIIIIIDLVSAHGSA